MRRGNQLNKENLLRKPQGRRKRGRPQPTQTGEMNKIAKKMAQGRRLDRL